MPDILVNVGEEIEPGEEAVLEAFLRALDEFREVEYAKKGYARLHVRYTGLAYGCYLQQHEEGCRRATAEANWGWLTAKRAGGRIE